MAHITGACMLLMPATWAQPLLLNKASLSAIRRRVDLWMPAYPLSPLMKDDEVIIPTQLDTTDVAVESVMSTTMVN